MSQRTGPIEYDMIMLDHIRSDISILSDIVRHPVGPDRMSHSVGPYRVRSDVI